VLSSIGKAWKTLRGQDDNDNDSDNESIDSVQESSPWEEYYDSEVSRACALLVTLARTFTHEEPK
jgi:hypothetical protein